MITLSDVSIGQLGPAVMMRNRLAQTQYNGQALINFGTPPLQLSIERSSLDMSFGTNWLEIYADCGMPQRIAVRDLLDEGGFTGSWGIWVDSAFSALPIRHKYLETIRLEGFRHARAFRIRQGGLPTDETGVDLTATLAGYFEEPPDLSDTAPQPNLYLPGLFDGLGMGGSTDGGGHPGGETSTGYPLTYWENATSGNFTTPPWPAAGVTMPAGIYVFSFYWKNSTGSGFSSGVFTLGYQLSGQPNAAYVTTRRVDATSNGSSPSAGTYQRISFPFFFPGTGTIQLTGSVSFRSTVAFISMGLPAIHRGRVAAPYTFPVNNAASPTTNDTASRITAKYFAQSAPTSGTYIQGDIVWNTNPVVGGANGVIGWVCVSAGPGAPTFKPFGTILSS
jgi:hypothetical protein